MADRHDIDALLVGALYGELDAADRALLDTHLASHPQDRAALDAMHLTRTRVSESLGELSSAEPSAGISALLLQEAARRAPSRSARRGTDPAAAGWLALVHSFLQPLFAHPAMAAAAALVLVGGTAGALYLRGGSGFYAAEAPALARAPSAQAPAMTAAPPAIAPGELYQATLDDRDEKLGAAGPTGTAATVGAGGVATGNAAGDPAGEAMADLKDLEKNEVALGFRGAASGAAVESGRDPARQGRDKDSLARATDGNPSAVTFTIPSMPPGAKVVTRDAKRDVATRDDAKRKIDNDDRSRDRYVAVTTPEPELKSADEADVAVQRKPSAAKPAPAPAVAASKEQVVTNDDNGTFRRESAGLGAAPAAAAPAPWAAPPPAPAATARYDAVRDRQLESWARGQHQKLVAAVKRNDCSAAATLGAELSRRAAEYYIAQVVDDRAIRSCRPAIDRARKKDTERRAKARAIDPPSDNESAVDSR